MKYLLDKSITAKLVLAIFAGVIGWQIAMWTTSRKKTNSTITRERIEETEYCTKLDLIPVADNSGKIHCIKGIPIPVDAKSSSLFKNGSIPGMQKSSPSAR